MKAAEVDMLLIEGVESLDEYLDEHEAARVKLKQGFLMLTKAKLRLPEHALTEISYHEEFEASRVVTLDSDGNWRLQDASDTELQEKSGKPSLHRRRAGKNSKEDDPAGTVIKSGSSSKDTLLWFSSLPPSDLRQAQKQFSNGLQALLLAASSARKVQRTVHGVSTSQH